MQRLAKLAALLDGANIAGKRGQGFEMKSMLLGLAIAAFGLVTEVAAEERFFPPGAWGKSQGAWTEQEQAAFYEKWFGGQLAAMQEQPLVKLQSRSGADSVMRLLFVPTFDHAGMVRVTFRPGGKVNYEFKRLSGAGGYEAGDVDLKERGNLREDRAEAVRALFAKIAPFTTKTPSQVYNPDYVCFDGTQIVLEFASAEDYQAITRHECEMGRSDYLRALVHLLDEVARNRLIAKYTFDDPA